MKNKINLIESILFITLMILPQGVLAETNIGINYMVRMAGMTLPKTAQTGDWQWQDVSDKLPARDGRPVWAIAQMGGYWYFTDGLPFDAGGYVMRTNGKNYENITLKISELGLERVDDIRSNGTEVAFLQDVVKRDGSIKTVIYDSEYKLSEGFDKGGGLASLQGLQGVWLPFSYDAMIQAPPFDKYPFFATGTTFQQAFTLIALNAIRQQIDEGKLTLDKLDFLSEATSTGELLRRMLTLNEPPIYMSDLAYSIRHVSPADEHDYLPIASALNEKFFLQSIRDAYKDKNRGMTTFFKFGEGDAYVDVTEQIGKIAKLHAMASNGSQILIAGASTSTLDVTDCVYLYNGTSTTDLTEKAAALPFKNWNRVQIAWNGKSWMILSGKNLVRFDGRNFEDLGRTRDYFVSIEGAPNGQFYLGGLVSTKDSDKPSEPFVSKLVVVSEGDVESMNTIGNEPSIMQKTTSTSLEMKNDETLATTTTQAAENVMIEESRMTKQQNMVEITSPDIKRPALLVASSTDNLLSAHAFFPKGISKIDLMINGKTVKTCSFPDLNIDQTCSTNFDVSKYPAMSWLNFKAVATDADWNTMNSEAAWMVVVDKGTLSGAITVYRNHIDGFPNKYQIQADVDAGLKRVEIWSGNKLVKACDYEAKSMGFCDFDFTSDEFPNNSMVFAISKVIDVNSGFMWTMPEVMITE